MQSRHLRHVGSKNPLQQAPQLKTDWKQTQKQGKTEIERCWCLLGCVSNLMSNTQSISVTKSQALDGNGWNQIYNI